MSQRGVLEQNRATGIESAENTNRSTFVNAALYVILFTIAVTAMVTYKPALGVGFLLDDFSHLDYAFRAMHGDWSDLLRVFTGNWTGATDNLTSYRPLVSVSFCVDYLLWQLNAAGYHLSNLVMFAGCSIFTALIAHELSAPLANTRTRLAITLAAGMLFAFYPLHPEAVVWIIGRVDVQCGIFYLCSLYSWMTFRRCGTPLRFTLALLAFACALPTKEMAVTLPAIVTLSELILPADKLGWQKLSLRSRLTYAGSFWLMLGSFAVLRTLALGTLVGGYGGGGLKEFFHSIKNFLDRDTWAKVICGVNEELPSPPILPEAAKWLFGTLAALATLRIGEKSTFWRILVFLLLWAGVSELPTFQIWHVYPNLCGSRLLFLPSAPLCMILSMVALVPFACLNLPQTAKFGKVPQWLGAAVLTGVSLLWCTALQTNLVPWIKAGVQMNSLTSQVRELAETTPPGKVTLLLDLPQDISGAGLLGRPEFLERLLRPPLNKTFAQDKVISAECPIPGSHDYVYPRLAQSLIQDNNVHAIYIWNKLGCYDQWHAPSGQEEFQTSIDKEFVATNDTPIYWLHEDPIDPSKVQVIELAVNSSTPELAGKLQLVWRSQHQEKSWIDYSPGPTGTTIGDKIVFVPSRFRTWLYHGAVMQLGLRVEPGTSIQMRSIESAKPSQYFPTVNIHRISEHTSVNQNVPPSKPVTDSRSNSLSTYDTIENHIALSVHPDDQLKISYDYGAIQGAQQAELVMTKSGEAFVPLALASPTLPPKRLLVKESLKGPTGVFSIPYKKFDKAGFHQVCLLTTDSHGHPTSLMSEPVTFRVLPR